MIRILFTIVIGVTMSRFSQAMPQYYNSISGQFPSGALVHKCVTCHVSKGSLALNLFAKDYRAVFLAPDPLKIPGINVMTYKQKMDLLLNKMDSNKNGVSNFEDILKGNNPGVVQ